MFSELGVFLPYSALPRLPGRSDKPQDLHRGLALRTLKDGSWSWRTGFNHDLQYKLHQRQQFFGITVQEPIVPDAAKALGQDVLEKALDELVGRQKEVE